MAVAWMFQSRFRFDKTKQMQAGLEQVQQAHSARYKHSLSTQGLIQSLRVGAVHFSAED